MAAAENGKAKCENNAQRVTTITHGTKTMHETINAMCVRTRHDAKTARRLRSRHLLDDPPAPSAPRLVNTPGNARPLPVKRRTLCLCAPVSHVSYSHI